MKDIATKKDGNSLFEMQKENKKRDASFIKHLDIGLFLLEQKTQEGRNYSSRTYKKQSANNT